MSATVIKEFRLPDLGEGLTESEILSWKVGVGDTVSLNQVIAEVETAKAVVELPSPFAGVIRKLHEQPGTIVEVGKPIVSFEVSDDAGTLPGAAGTAAAGPASPTSPAGKVAAPAPELTSPAAELAGQAAELASQGGPAPDRLVREATRQPNLVGYGAVVESSARPARRPRTLSPVPPDTTPSRAVTRVGSRRDHTRPKSTPPVRKFAKDLGVDLALVQGTGTQGLITREDVQHFLDGQAGAASEVTAPAGALGRQGERETRIPVKGVRKLTAAAMVASAFTAPHVTEFLTVDVTPAMKLLTRLKNNREFSGSKLTPLTLAAKAVLIALRRNQALNARWDEENQEIVQFHYVNLGIAAATPRGLTVPNIKNADALSLRQLAEALTELTDKARAGKTTPADLSGGTMSITNIGVFGIDAGTPILNPGEAAILALGAVRNMPWEYQGNVALRQVLTLSLSFDHRLVDGEQGSRFLADVGAILADPGMVLAMV